MDERIHCFFTEYYVYSVNYDTIVYYIVKLLCNMC